MSIDHTEIRLSPEQQLAIAKHAEREGKSWTEVVAERFPDLPEPSKKELQESLAMLERGLKEIDSGGGHDAVEALKKLGIDYGFPVNE